MAEIPNKPSHQPDDAEDHLQADDALDGSSFAELVDDSGRINTSLPCPDCDYELIKQPLTGKCPECGQAIVSMLERNPISLAPGKWVGKLKWGTVFMLAGLLGWPLVIVGLELPAILRIGYWLETLLILAPIVLLILGIRLLCAKEPGVTHAGSAEATARAGRTAAVAAVAVIACSIVLSVVGDYLFWISHGVYYVLFAITSTLLATAIMVGITASVYRLDALHSRQRPRTKRFGGAALKYLLARFIWFFVAAWILQHVDVWLFIYSDVDHIEPVFAIVIALLTGFVLLCMIIFAVWLLVLLVARFCTFRHAHRIAASREAARAVTE